MNRSELQKVRRVVVKVGSGVVSHPSGGLRDDVIESLAEDIAQLIQDGRQVVLVSSGAVAEGKVILGFHRLKNGISIPQQQACAAVGQARLIWSYERCFDQFGQKVGQVLLTRDDLENRRRYLNARNTLFTLLSMGVLPIVNENDTVMVEEIKFGDNDNLSALVTLMVEADLLVVLSTVEGLYTCDPTTGSGEFIDEVDCVDHCLFEQCDMSGISPLGRGGMRSKVEAIQKVVDSGIPAVIAKGGEEGVLSEILQGETIGTFFRPRDVRLGGKKRWIAYTLQPAGRIVIDDGAVRALAESGKSLLPSGIVAVEGEFEMGDAVSCVDKDGREIARGLTNYNSNEIRKIKGCHSGEIKRILGYTHSQEVIHRDNLVLMVH